MEDPNAYAKQLYRKRLLKDRNAKLRVELRKKALANIREFGGPVLLMAFGLLLLGALLTFRPPHL